MKELNLSDATGSPSLDELHDRWDTTLAYLRQNRNQYPPVQVWHIFRLDLLNQSFEMRQELRASCVARVKQLKDLMYHEEQHKQRKKLEEEERLAWEAEHERRHNDPKTLEYHIAKAQENKRRAREVEHERTTSET
jgi:hypothetical protein